MTATATGRYARLWEPVRVGTMDLRNRIMVPTHASGAGFILGSEREAERFIAYYVRRAQGGAAWIGGSSTFVEAPLIPGYSLGAYMERLFRNGARFIPMQRVTRIERDVVHAADVYAGLGVEHRDVDTVVLAYGGLARTRLHAELTGRVGELHMLGDAWSPRRLTTATRQAWELGRRL